MPVHIEPPDDLSAIHERVVTSVGGALGDLLTLSVPYQVGAVDLRSLANGDLSASWFARWRCLVGAGEPSIAVDVVRDTEVCDYVVVSISHGQMARRFNEAVNWAEENLGGEDYALSEIEIPGLHLSFARLVDPGAETEFLVPVLPWRGPEDEIAALRPYRPEDLTERLQAEARRALESRWD